MPAFWSIETSRSFLSKRKKFKCTKPKISEECTVLTTNYYWPGHIKTNQINCKIHCFVKNVDLYSSHSKYRKHCFGCGTFSQKIAK